MRFIMWLRCEMSLIAGHVVCLGSFERPGFPETLETPLRMPLLNAMK